MADGFTLIVPKEMIDRLEVADKKIDQLARTSENASSRIIAAFNEMSTKGVDKFIESLNKAQTELSKLSQTKVNLDSMFNTTKSVSEITKLIEALAKLSKVQNKETGGTSKQETSEAQKINALYRERMALTKQLSSLMLKGEKLVAKGGSLRPEESAQISTIRSLIQAKEAEINIYKKSANLNTKAKQALMKGEMEFTLFVAEETRKLKEIKDKARQDEIVKEQQKQKQLAELDSKNRQANYNRYVTSYEGSLRTSDKAKNLLQEEQAIKNLEAAKKKLNKTDADYANKLETLNQAINKHKQHIKDANLTNEQREKIAKRNTEAAEREAKALERKNKLEREKRITSSADNAINFSRSKEIKSINDQIKAIQLLKQARDKLQKSGNTSKYEQDIRQLTIEINRQQASVDALIKKQQALGQSHNSLMNTGDQLARKLAMVFSVSAIQGYIQKLANVRAEFELNQRALEAILQSKDKADEIWGQTVQLALKSPFRVKELVSYTKQLAAYRIESDKLFETNKMLADVSAGLGVDMQRLILAYGQVRAAEYLRGTELRQFTEAGIPMLDELAKYFTELEGRAISTAEVFSRISKRMVVFADVEEVFKRITSAGGVFYQMQEKQADTLYGQISNLHDALDLMMNDIGASNEGILKGGVEIARKLVDNWEEVWDRLKYVLYLFAAIKTSAFLYARGIKAAATATSMFGVKVSASTISNWKFWASMKQGELVAAGWGKWTAKWIIGLNRLKIAMLGVSSAMRAFLPMLVISGVVELYMQFTAASRAAERLQEDLQNIQDSIGKEKDESLDNYKKLAEKINNVTTSYIERKEAMEELKRTFKDILPDYMLEIEYLQSLAGEYGSVQLAMEAFFDAKSRREQKAKIDEDSKEAIARRMKELEGLFTFDDIDAYIKRKQGQVELGTNPIAEYELEQHKQYILSDDLKDALRNHWITSIKEVVEDVKNGEIAANYEAMKDAIIQKFETWYGRALTEAEKTSIFSKYFQHSGGVFGESWSIEQSFGGIIEELQKYEKVNQSTATTKGKTWAEEKYGKAIQKEKAELDKLNATYASLKKSLEEYYKLKKKEEQKGLTEQEQKDIEQLEKDIDKGYKDLAQQKPDLKGITKDVISLRKETDGIWQGVLTDMATKLDPSLKKVNEQLVQMPKTLSQAVSGIPDSFAGNNIFPSPEEVTDTTNIVGGFFDTYGKLPASPFTLSLSNLPQKAQESAIAMGQFTDELIEGANKLNATDLEKFTQDVTREVAQSMNLTSDLFDVIAMKSGDTLEKFHQNGEAKMSSLLSYYNETKRIIEQNPTRADFILNMRGYDSMADLEQDKKQADAIKEILLRTGWEDKNNKKNNRKGSNPAKDFAKVLEDMYKSYQNFNKKFDKGDASERVKKNWTEAFEAAKNKVKGFNLELKDFDFTSIEGLTAAFVKLEKTAQGKKIAADMKKTLSGLTDERDAEVEEKREELRDREIDQMFELYDIYKDLEKLGIDKKAAKGLFGIDATSLDEMRSKLEQMKAAGQFTGTDDEKAYQKYLDKITEMENKAQQERLKTYLKYSRDAMTDRAKIKFEELQKLAEIEKTFAIKEGDTEEVKEIKNTQRTAAIEAVQKESAQQTNKSLWEDFQKSDIFLSVFQDAENASVTMMEHVLAKLRGFKAEWANMPLESVKQITQKMTELENKLIEAQNPFKALREINKKIQEELTVTTTGADGKEVKTTISKEQLESDATAAQSQIDINNTEIAQLGVINELLTEGKLINSEQQAIYENLTGDTDVNLDTIKNEVKARKDANKNLQATVDKNNKVNNLQNQGKKALLKQADAIRQCNKMANDLYGAFAEIWEVAGGDEVTKMFADMGMSIATSVLDTIALQMQLSGATVAATGFGAAMNSAMGIIGWIVLAVQIIAKVLSTVFAAHDKGLQEDIEKIDEEINVLQKSLEKLEEQLETVYSSTNLVSTMRKANSNIEQQIAKRRQQIELEKEKKSEDEDQIKAWEDEIVELQEKAVEMRKEMVESLGGTYDIRSFAREFADAWIQAFEETGDGLKGLQDNFREFMKNVLLEQAVMKGLGNIMQPVIDAINTALENNYQVDKLELNKIKKAAEDAMLQGNIFMKSLFGDGGIFSDYVNDTSSSLSGLQEGIQGVTEETAQIIEAYLNSIRFYIAQDNQNLAKLTQFFTGGEDIENPMLSQLKIIATQTSAIRMVFDSIVRGGHSQGGFGVKVFID